VNALDVEWDSGVGGAQCEDCGRFTIVRSLNRDILGEPVGWICRPCAIGWTDEELEDR
jgi:hypothetical protein